MDSVKVGDVIGYWDRSDTYDPDIGWQRNDYLALVVKVKRRAIYVRNLKGGITVYSPDHPVIADGENFEKTVRIICRDRCYAV